MRAVLNHSIISTLCGLWDLTCEASQVLVADAPDVSQNSPVFDPLNDWVVPYEQKLS